MRLPFKIALRFLKSSKGQTIMIVLGIGIGVSVQVFIGSLIQGLQKSLIDKTIGNSPQITIASNLEDNTIEGWEKKLSLIKESDSRIIKISPAVDASGFALAENKTMPILFRGLIFENSNNIYKIQDKLIEGTLPVKTYEVLIGKELQTELGVKLGDKIIISTPVGVKNEVSVTGIFDLKVANINKSWIISDLSTSQQIFNYGDKITSIEIQVSDVFKADEIAKIAEEKLSDKAVKINDWKSQNAELLSGLSGQSTSSIMIQVFVLISVILGIASVLAISVLQKSKQLGILKAMGIKDSAASLIFLFQGFILGVMGAVLGIIFGLGLSYSFTKFALNPDGTPVVALYIDNNFIILSAVIAVIAATVASVIPARRSSKLNPIEVIKNG